VLAEEDADSFEAEEAEDEAGPLPPSSLLSPPLPRRRTTDTTITTTTTELHVPTVIRPTTSTPNLHSSSSSPVMSSRSFRRPSPQRSGDSRRTQRHRSTPSQSLPRTFPANPRTGRPLLEYWKLPWGHDQADLVDHFGPIFEWIDAARKAAREEGDDGAGNVLVHCQCGVSRSASVCVAYVMWLAHQGRLGLEEMDGLDVRGMHDAYEFVKKKSEWIGPNMVWLCLFVFAILVLTISRQSLVYQLCEYERVLSGADSEFAASSDEEGMELARHNMDDSSSESHLSTPDAQHTPDGFAPVDLPETNKPTLSIDTAHLPLDANDMSTTTVTHASVEALSPTLETVLDLSSGGLTGSPTPRSGYGMSFSTPSPPPGLSGGGFGFGISRRERRERNERTFSADLQELLKASTTTISPRSARISSFGSSPSAV
jgi:hypothetical protein